MSAYKEIVKFFMGPEASSEISKALLSPDIVSRRVNYIPSDIEVILRGKN
jgi:hypothetical protein